MGPFIISIGEDFDTFIAYVQEFFQLHNPPSVAVEFGGAERHWGSPVLTADNIKPMFRLLRVREGVDMLHVWPAVDAAMDDTSDVMRREM